MNTIINQRLALLRSVMAEKQLSAYYIPTADYHLSEYVGEHFKFRAWLSGFTGSAGTLVVLPDEAGLWTDGRYFLQAEQQLKGTGITLYKMQMPKVPSVEEFLTSRLSAGSCVGFDGRTLSASAGEKMSETLAKKQIHLDASLDLASIIWENRPSMSKEKIWIYEETYAGQSVSSKLSALRQEMVKKGADTHIICALDEIAWLFNLRGSDVDYNPVFLSYAVIEKEKAFLFTDMEKLDANTCRYIERQDVQILPYDSVYDFIRRYSNSSVLLSKSQLNYTLFHILKEGGASILCSPDPVTGFKAAKNETEISWSKKAHIKDGVIMVRFMKWLKEQIQNGCPLTEASAAAYLDGLRKAAPGNLGLSFETISGYGPHGAIVHYAVTKETDIPLKARGLYLVDSGGQYIEGTTDITRTFALGPLTAEEKKHFALVLRCMLSLMSAVFPEGVCFQNLDALARTPLWQQGLDYLHGTGHGVGHLLNVHEGPNSFNWRMRSGTDPVPVRAGMITTDEPGVYISGKHGIRLENELLCLEKERTDYGTFLCFEPLTLAPIDLDALDPSLISDFERQILNSYHKKVYETLSPYLTSEEKQWLAGYTRKI